MARRGTSGLNLILGVNKPVGITSHDVVARVRRALDERRVGHAGTLDPLASGVMVVGVGQGTRLLGQLTLDTKRYIARVAWGAETSTDDAEGEVVRTVAPDPALADPAFAADAVRALTGKHLQVPPAYSAISINGVRSYRRARAGEDVDLPARPIEVFDALLLGIEQDDDQMVWTCAFTVSKGTYIRALARDLGRAHGGAAHLVGLTRTMSGCVGLGSCVEVEGLTPQVASEHALDPVAALGLEAIEVPERHIDDVRCGRRIPCGALGQAAGAEAWRVALVVGGELCALAHIDQDHVVMDQVFPQGIGGIRS